MLGIGEYKRQDVKDKNAAAALMQTIQMIFNMEEAIVRG